MTAISPGHVVAVFERHPYWGPELQRQLNPALIIVRECRAIRDLQTAINDFDSALLVIDLNSSLADCLTWLNSAVMGNGNRCPIIAHGSADLLELEWVLRDAGVTAFVPEVMSGDNFARLCRRQLGLK